VKPAARKSKELLRHAALSARRALAAVRALARFEGEAGSAAMDLSLLRRQGGRQGTIIADILLFWKKLLEKLPGGLFGRDSESPKMGG
jgi:hypothetical protein